MNSTLRRALLLVLCLVCVAGVLLLPACKKAGERAAEEYAESMIEKSLGQKADVDIDSGQITIQTDEGAFSAGQSAEWPADLPPGIPVFTHGDVKGSSKLDMPQGVQWTIVLQDIEPDGIQKYVEELKAAGWNILVSSSTAEGGMVQAEKDMNNVVVAYSTSDRSGGITVTAKSL